jgi:hypothetical protein
MKKTTQFACDAPKEAKWRNSVSEARACCASRHLNGLNIWCCVVSDKIFGVLIFSRPVSL